MLLFSLIASAAVHASVTGAPAPPTGALPTGALPAASQPPAAGPASSARSAAPASAASSVMSDWSDWSVLRAAPPSDWTFTRADGTVHLALSRWAREAGWQLVWEVDRDFPIDAEVTLRGNFVEALEQAMAALRDTDCPLQARLQPQTRVLRIDRYRPDGARR